MSRQSSGRTRRRDRPAQPGVLRGCRLAGKAGPEGSVDQNIRVAMAKGVSPVHAVQMATINIAETF